MSCFQSITAAEKYHDAGMYLYYNDDTYSQGFGEFVSCFRPLAKD